MYEPEGVWIRIPERPKSPEVVWDGDCKTSNGVEKIELVEKRVATDSSYRMKLAVVEGRRLKIWEQDGSML